ncbi:MAG: hypothetical protein QM780_08280 [Hyphomicrobium sp.]|uniref:hypothetical protein n=1 Tax=Hyphomicrobium sp. TaxID=82 RepID=UPI0039E344F0
MKIGRLILLGAFVLGAAASAEAASTAPRLSAEKSATLVADKEKPKKKVHAHKAGKQKVAQTHKVKKVKKSKKT